MTPWLLLTWRRDADRVFEGLVMSEEERKVLMKFIDHRMRPQVGRVGVSPWDSPRIHAVLGGAGKGD
jgi:hypothetical protein